jgi:hypothetical protein
VLDYRFEGAKKGEREEGGEGKEGGEASLVRIAVVDIDIESTAWRR